jgi:hypothetical protein
MDKLRETIQFVVAGDAPMTVRQVFYRLVALGAIRKTETEYKSTVVRLLSEMRRDGDIPFSWITDNTRWMRKPQTHSDLAGTLTRFAHTYRRDFWEHQDDYVEVWLEKEALAGVFYGVTEEWDVPLMVTRGYPSITFLHDAAYSIAAEDRPTFLYYFGDYDPSGLDISRAVEEGIEEFAPWADFMFKRVAVTLEQVAKWRLPSRPTKRSDTRSRYFQGESVEIDAIEPSQLRTLVSDCIVQHVDGAELSRIREIEAAERDTLAHIAAQLREAV